MKKESFFLWPKGISFRGKLIVIFVVALFCATCARAQKVSILDSVNNLTIDGEIFFGNRVQLLQLIPQDTTYHQYSDVSVVIIPLDDEVGIFFQKAARYPWQLIEKLSRPITCGIEINPQHTEIHFWYETEYGQEEDIFKVDGP